MMTFSRMWVVRSGLALLLLGGICLWSTGCRKMRPSSAGISIESYPGISIKVNSVYFEQRFQVTRYSAAKDDRGRLRVSVTMRNLKGDTAFEYRYRWLDKDGIEVPSNLSVWQQMSTAGGEEALMTGIAPHQDIEDFILDIRLFHSSTRW
jgi:uncharacterized protein YcfL